MFKTLIEKLNKPFHREIQPRGNFPVPIPIFTSGLENVLLALLEAVDQHQSYSQSQIEALKLYFYHKISCPERKRVKAKSLHKVSQRNSCRRFIRLSRDYLKTSSYSQNLLSLLTTTKFSLTRPMFSYHTSHNGLNCIQK